MENTDAGVQCCAALHVMAVAEQLQACWVSRPLANSQPVACTWLSKHGNCNASRRFQPLLQCRHACQTPPTIATAGTSLSRATSQCAASQGTHRSASSCSCRAAMRASFSLRLAECASTASSSLACDRSMGWHHTAQSSIRGRRVALTTPRGNNGCEAAAGHGRAGRGSRHDRQHAPSLGSRCVCSKHSPQHRQDTAKQDAAQQLTSFSCRVRSWAWASRARDTATPSASRSC